MMFGNVIEYFDGILTKNKTYVVSNALIRQVNKIFLNLHPKIELESELNTIVTEA